MAFCHECGSPLNEGSSFCGNCGTPVKAAVTPVASEAPAPEAAAPAADAAPAAEPQAATQPQTTYTAQNASRQPYAGQPYQAAPAQPAVKGPLGKAWDDFFASPSKIAIVLKLALAQFVPTVGSLMLSGYVYHWGKARALNRDEVMPGKIVRPGVLDSGLYAYATSLIASVCLFICMMIIMAIFGALDAGITAATHSVSILFTSLATLLLIVLCVFAIPFIQVMNMRAAICGRVRSGLKLSEVFNMMFKSSKLGKFMGAAILPYLLAGVVVGLVSLIFFMLFAGIIGASSLGSYSAYGYYSTAFATASVLSSIFAMGLFGIILLAIYLFFVFFVYVAAQLVSIRAFGYILEEFAPASWSEYQENSARYAKETL